MSKSSNSDRDGQSQSHSNDKDKTEVRVGVDAKEIEELFARMSGALKEHSGAIDKKLEDFVAERIEPIKAEVERLASFLEGLDADVLREIKIGLDNPRAGSIEIGSLSPGPNDVLVVRMLTEQHVDQPERIVDYVRHVLEQPEARVLLLAPEMELSTVSIDSFAPPLNSQTDFDTRLRRLEAQLRHM